MRLKSFFFALLITFAMNVNSQSVSPWSGTIRFSGGFLGVAMLYCPMFTGWLLYEGFSPKGYGFTYLDWARDNHLSFLRFFNACYDFRFPHFSMSFSKNNIKVDHIYSQSDNTFVDLFFTNDSYSNYIGYYLNWTDKFSKMGFYLGMDYELRKFSLEYKSDIPDQYHYWHSNIEIQSVVPSVGLRYRVISPEKEMDGFPFNIVLEAGISYAVVINYEDKLTRTDNLTNYSIDVLNNGFRSLLGVAITTNEWGSLYVRWTKDFYNIYNNEYIANDKDGYLYGNEIKNSFSCISVGWATFL